MRTVYLAATVVGAAAPWRYFLPILAEHGFDFRLFVDQLFASAISSFFAMDVLVSALVLSLWVICEGRKQGIQHGWVAIVGTWMVGVSFGLPLFLWMRETRLKSSDNTGRIL